MKDYFEMILLLPFNPKRMNKLVCICAGGTGGHINAALGLGEYFKARDFWVNFYTGTRYLDHQLFKSASDPVFHMNSKPLRGKTFLFTVQNALLNFFVFLTALFKFASKRPLAVVGAGGYVCGPTLLAAKILGIRIYIIEQNAVAGLTNKLLAKIATKIFVNFEKTKGINLPEKTIVSGNPIRGNIKYSPAEPNVPFRILIFGGSLGASQINDVVERLAAWNWDSKISIIHQVGRGNLKSFPVNEKVKYRQEEYLTDMDEMYRWAHIIVSRAGASTISELREAKRPCILIPYPLATDNHQELNAKELKEEGLFHVKVINQDLAPEEMEKEVGKAIQEIIEKKCFFPYKKEPVPDSCKIIFEQVMGDVRNQ